MRKLLLLCVLAASVQLGFAQDCADCSISLPELPDPETVGATTIYEFSAKGVENDCFGLATDPSWSVGGSASIVSGANAGTVTISATGPFTLTLDQEDSDGDDQSCTLQTAGIVADNPDFAIDCGLDVIIVLDESNSISSQEEDSVRRAIRSFATALKGTGSNMAIVEFGTRAEAEVLSCNLGTGNENYFELTDANINSCLDNYITSDYGITSSGGTNWDDAFVKVQDVIANNAIQPDIVIFFTDGNPTYYNDESNFDALGGSGSTVYTSAVNHAIVQANNVKANTHLYVVGVGDGINVENLKVISGLQTGGNLIEDDYVVSPSFDALSDDFFQLALLACGTDVNITKEGPTCVENNNTTATYVITVENEGAQDALNVEIKDVVPFGYNVLSQVRNPSVGTVFDVNNTFTWNYGTLPVNTTATWTFTIQIPANSGTNTNLAYVGASNIFPEADDTASVTTKVNDISISGTATDNLCGAVNIGAIDLTVIGGTQPFTYAWSNGDTTQDLTALPAGDYSVTVTDALGCPATASFTIEESTDVTVSLAPFEFACGNLTCNGSDDGSIDATISGGTAPYTYSWSGSGGYSAATEDISDLAPGTYTLNVVDVNGCAGQATVALFEAPPITTSAVVSDVSCNDDSGAGSDGSIDVTVSGGCEPYTYSWSNGATTQDLTDVSAGTYTVTITDANGCITSLTRTIDQPELLRMEFETTDVVCNDGSGSSDDGTIDITVFGGTAPYSYSWDNGSTDQDLANLAAGSYTLTVTDANDCQSEITAIISQPGGLTITETHEDVTCNDDSGTSDDGSIDISVSGGTAPYTYSWSNGATTQDVDNLSAGTYAIVVTDANGCSNNETIEITQPNKLTLTETHTDVVCNDDSGTSDDGTIDLSVTGGTGSYSYAWSNSATSQDLSGLAAGTYSVVVTDASGCSASVSVTIEQPDRLTLSETHTDVVCNDDAGTSDDGTIDLSVSGGTGSYSYAWSNSATTQGLSDLSAGTYTVIVTDAAGCTAAISVTIEEPNKLTLSETHTDVTCNDDSGTSDDGTIDLSVSGGTGGYTYAWSNGATTQDLNALAAGTYTVTVTDAAGCTAGLSVTIEQPQQLSLTETHTDVTCNDDNGTSDDGTIDLTVTGGTGAYTYAWNNGATSEDLSGLAAGTYNVTVTDANGCTAAISITIEQPQQLTLSDSHTDVLCNDDAGTSDDGTINLQVNGGTLPYSFNWSNGETTEDLSDLAAGTYTVVVTDGNGCTANTSVTIEQPVQLTLSDTHTDVICNDDSGTSDDGTIDLSVNGGTAPYSYSWSNGSTNQDLSGLAAGSYTVTVTDANDCVASRTIVIEQPDNLNLTFTKTDVVCNDQGGSSDDGTIDLSVSGGTAPYSYNWSNGATTEDLSGLAAGSYTVTVQDANNCIAVLTVIISQPGDLVITETHTDVTCNDDAGTSDDGSIDISVSGGTTPYTYSWNNGTTTQDLSGLAAGTYSVIVTDANGCSSSETIVITQPEQLVLSETHTDVICNDDNGASNDGTIDLSVSGGKSPYTYSWSNGSTTQNLSDLSAGDYTVIVTDANGCTASISVTIEIPNLFTLNTVSTNVTCNDDAGTSDDGTIDLFVSGGTAPYFYDWSNGETTQDLNDLAAGTYDVTVTDIRGCQTSTSVTITQPEQLALTETHVDVTCNDDAGASDDGSIDVSVDGGTPPYSYNWSNGATTQDISGLEAGSYTITVSDGNDCVASLTVVIEAPDQLTLSETHTDVTCNDDSGLSNDGSIDLSIAGGNGNNSILWSNGATTEDITDLSPGTYTVVVTDENGCTASVSVTIEAPEQLVLTETHSDVTCNDQNGTSDNGSIDLSVAGGTAPYTYDWSNGTTTQDLSGLVAGTYTVVVTDASGCTASTSVTIEIPEQLVVTETHVDATCFDGQDGSIDLTVSGGTTPYSYSWTNGSNEQDISNLSAGTYVVSVTDAQDCSFSLTVVIDQPEAVTISGEVENVVCDNTGFPVDGSIDISVTGGNGPYTYAWSNGSTSEDIDALTEGTYTVVATDINGCTGASTFNVQNNATPPIASATGGTLSCLSGSVQLVGTGPFGALFSWTGPGGFTSDEKSPFVSLPGIYTLTVTHPTTGCITIVEAEVTGSSDAPIATATGGTLTCDVFSVELTASSDTPGAQYQWNINGQSLFGQTVIVAQAGTYTVTVTNPANGCSSTAQAIVTENKDEPDVAVEGGQLTCKTLAIQLLGSSATPNAGYSWVGPNAYSSDEQNPVITVPGTYTLTVTDPSNGCTASASTTVSQDTQAPGATAQGGTITCDDPTVQLSAGTTAQGVQYLWEGPNGFTSTEQNPVVSEPGTYSVFVSYEVTGCASEATAVVDEDIDQPSVSASVSGEITCTVTSVQLFANTNASDADYSWTGPGGFTSNAQNPGVSVAGTYTVTITDNSNGCDASASTEVEQNNEDFQISTSSTDESCDAANNGTATVIITGGTGSFSVEWSNGGQSETIENLSAGTYTVTVTASNGCSQSADVTIGQSQDQLNLSATSSSVSCGGGDNTADGSVDLTVSGGTAPYTYSWNTGSTDEDIDGLTGGSYTVVVTDANGCTATLTETVESASGLSVSIEAISEFNCGNVSCFDSNDGFIDLTVEGGTAPYTFDWSNGSTEEDPVDLLAGTYSVVVTDANGCTATASATLVAPEPITVEPDTISLYPNGFNISCFGESDGFIQVSSSGGCAPYVYEWSNGATGPVITGLPEGSYTVTITDGAGCSITAVYDIDAPDPVVVNVELDPDVPTACDGESVQLDVDDNYATYQWFLNGEAIPGATAPQYDATEAGDYQVVISDEDNCIGETPSNAVEVTFEDREVVNLNLTGDSSVCDDASVELTATVGFDSYVWYQDGDVISGQTGASIVVTESGTYTVAAFNANGCEAISPDEFNVNIAAAIDPSLTQDGSVLCPDNKDGIELSTDEGFESYDWFFEGDQIDEANGPVISITEAGNYTVVVTNADGCTGSASIDAVFEAPVVTTDTVIVDIIEMEGNVICLSTDDVLDNIGDIESIIICSAPTLIDYTIENNGDEVCIEIDRTSEESGMDMLCILTCDNSECGICDRTIILLNLPDIDEPPVAVEECVDVEQDSKIEVDVLANDSDPDGDALYVSAIIDGPSTGTAIIQNGGQSVLYIPDPGQCEADTFYYEVCDLDNAGCDTAFVCVTVICECFIPNVLTPNNDNLNDEFIVECLEQIEDGGVLRVYNRWGNEVYRNDQYRNDWNGTYDGEPLPEGTYYYVISFTDLQGEFIEKAGDLTILR